MSNMLVWWWHKLCCFVGYHGPTWSRRVFVDTCAVGNFVLEPECSWCRVSVGRGTDMGQRYMPNFQDRNDRKWYEWNPSGSPKIPMPAQLQQIVDSQARRVNKHHGH